MLLAENMGRHVRGLSMVTVADSISIGLSPSLAVTLRFSRDGGRPTQEWVSLTGDFGLRF
jgi:hypothetical protein